MPKIYYPSDSVHWDWISLAGPDAKDFLHRLTTVNMNELEAGKGANGCFLNAQGQFRSYFTVWNYGSDEYFFELDGGVTGHWKKAFLQTLEQYTFAEKMVLTNPSLAPEKALLCCWIFPKDQEFGSLGALHTVAGDEEIRLCNHGSVDFGRPWVTAWGRPARLRQWLDRAFSDATALRFENLEEWRVSSLRPRVDAEITDKSNPLELGLLDAVSQNKGCYPGQEVIERTISLGAPARRLSLIEGEGNAPQAGDKIINLAEPPLEIGKVTSVIVKEGGQKYAALGLIRKISAIEGLGVQFESNTAGSKASIVRISSYT